MHATEAYIVLEGDGVPCCEPGQFVLLPRAHVTVLADLPPEFRATVLAGLSRLTGAARLAYPTSALQVCPHAPGGEVTAPAHLHFHLAAAAGPR